MEDIFPARDIYYRSLNLIYFQVFISSEYMDNIIYK